MGGAIHICTQSRSEAIIADLESRLAKKDAELKQMREALEPDSYPSTPVFLNWVADRLVLQYKESNNVDFVQALRRKALKIQGVLDRRIEREER